MLLIYIVLHYFGRPAAQRIIIFPSNGLVHPAIL